MPDQRPSDFLRCLTPEQQDIVGDYDPYHLMPQFWEGFSAYRKRFFGCPYMGDANGQAWDRGLEAAMRIARRERERLERYDD